MAEGRSDEAAKPGEDRKAGKHEAFKALGPMWRNIIRDRINFLFRPRNMRSEEKAVRPSPVWLSRRCCLDNKEETRSDGRATAL